MYKGEDKEYICYPFKNGIMFTAGSVDGQHTAGSVDRQPIDGRSTVKKKKKFICSITYCRYITFLLFSPLSDFFSNMLIVSLYFFPLSPVLILLFLPPLFFLLLFHPVSLLFSSFPFPFPYPFSSLLGMELAP